MRFSTIWTLRGMGFMERCRRTRDCAAFGVARHLPLRVKYWTAIHMIGKATMDSPNVPATPLDEILQKLPCPKSMS